MLRNLYFPVIIALCLCLQRSSCFLSSTKFGRYSCIRLNKKSCVHLNANHQPQVLQFVEPLTNVTIVLVGSMHYNPTSITLTKDIIQSLANTRDLSAVMVESCPIRWNKSTSLLPTDVTKKSRPPSLLYLDDNSEWRSVLPAASTGPTSTTSASAADQNLTFKTLLRRILYNEMVAAYDTAIQYQVPVVLADQLINITNQRSQAAFQTAMRDLITPWQGGWFRLWKDIEKAVALALPSGPGYLGAGDFFDSRLLLSMPVTLVRYPLALLLKAPQIFIPIFLLAFLPTLSSVWSGGSENIDLSVFDLAGTTTSATADPSMWIYNFVQDAVSSLGIFLVEGIVLSRVFLITILAERNVVLARAILQHCQDIVASPSTISDQLSAPKQWQQYSGQVFTGHFNNRKQSSGAEQGEEARDKVVVAVLGMAHCNGIKKLMQEQLVDEEYQLLIKDQMNNTSK